MAAERPNPGEQELRENRVDYGTYTVHLPNGRPIFRDRARKLVGMLAVHHPTAGTAQTLANLNEGVYHEPLRKRRMFSLLRNAKDIVQGAGTIKSTPAPDAKPTKGAERPEMVYHFEPHLDIEVVVETITTAPQAVPHHIVRFVKTETVKGNEHEGTPITLAANDNPASVRFPLPVGRTPYWEPARLLRAILPYRSAADAIPTDLLFKKLHPDEVYDRGTFSNRIYPARRALTASGIRIVTVDKPQQQTERGKYNASVYIDIPTEHTNFYPLQFVDFLFKTLEPSLTSNDFPMSAAQASIELNKFLPFPRHTHMMPLAIIEEMIRRRAISFQVYENSRAQIYTFTPDQVAAAASVCWMELKQYEQNRRFDVATLGFSINRAQQALQRIGYASLADHLDQPIYLAPEHEQYLDIVALRDKARCDLSNGAELTGETAQALLILRQSAHDEKSALSYSDLFMILFRENGYNKYKIGNVVNKLEQGLASSDEVLVKIPPKSLGDYGLTPTKLYLKSRAA
jgi:hypothetical protein